MTHLYVLRDGELTTAPPVQKTLPEKPGYLFRLTLGLHPDIGDARTVTLDLPATEAELLDAQAQLGVEGWEGVAVIDYDGIIPYAAEFTDLPMELEEFNVLAAAVRDMPSPEKQLPKLKALLEQFEVRDIATAISLTEHLEDYLCRSALCQNGAALPGRWEAGAFPQIPCPALAGTNWP